MQDANESSDRTQPCNESTPEYRSLLRRVATQFQISARPADMAPYGGGHINDTFLAHYEEAGKAVRYIHQRINGRVFPRTDRLMENISRVTNHTATALRHAGVADLERRALILIPTTDGQPYAQIDGEAWRTYIFVERSRTINVPDTTALAYQAATTFGSFTLRLADLKVDELHETIADFHHTPRRYERLCQAAAADAHNRRACVEQELEFVHQRKTLLTRITDGLKTGDLPLRVTHNDTKLNNVLFDEVSDEGICVIDLDTVMPGSTLYDFGDMVRTVTSPAAEDETDLGRIHARPDYYEALAKGYAKAMGPLLTPNERELMPLSGLLITLETGIRFLTDHLEGDTYFKIHRRGHNLERCRAQFQLVKSIEDQLDLLHKLTPGG